MNLATYLCLIGAASADYGEMLFRMPHFHMRMPRMPRVNPRDLEGTIEISADTDAMRNAAKA
jgi:hypothetical protein